MYELCHVDIESRSRINLKTDGVYNYAQDYSTSISTLSYAFDDEPVQQWRAWQHAEFPEDLRDFFFNKHGRFAAHNAGFERLMFWYILCPEQKLPEPAIERFYCTAAQAAANALPRKLDECARALDAEYKKDMAGHNLMMKLCKPNKKGEWNEDEADMLRQATYCDGDVRAERSIHKLLRGLTAIELEQYHVGEYINDRGLLIDYELARCAQAYAEAEALEIGGRLSDLSDGKITTGKQYQRHKAWLFETVNDEWVRASDEIFAMCSYYKDDVKKQTLDKDTRYNLLSMQAEEPGFLTDEVEELIQCLDEAGRSSVAKFKNMQLRSDVDDHRVRGAYIFNGAGQTGRYSAVGLQLHNFVRNCYKGNIAEEMASAVIHGCLEDMRSGETVLDDLAKLLRPAVIAPEGKIFVCGDLRSIEARVLPWLSKHPLAEALLQIFRDNGDPYLHEAANIYNKDIEDVTDDERQVGKVADLSLGFGGAQGAFLRMAKAYRVMMTYPQATHIKDAWREANGWAVDFWDQLMLAAKSAVFNPGEIFHAGRIRYVCGKQGKYMTLWCLLPSGRIISYPDARMSYGPNKFGNEGWNLSCIKGSFKPKKDETAWPRMDIWHGILAENVTQAVSADVLRQKQQNVHHHDTYDMVLHTHDEIALEVLLAQARDAAIYLEQELKVVPEWATGLPLDCELWIGRRYRK